MTDPNLNASSDITVPDLLYGADAIAAFLGVTRPTVYHLAETKRIPFFKIGKTVCARRATLIAALKALEHEAA
jgi:excisionase family DNA binding protein